MKKSRASSIPPPKKAGKGVEIRMSRVSTIPKRRAGDDDEVDQSWLHPPKNGWEGDKDDQSWPHPALWGGGM